MPADRGGEIRALVAGRYLCVSARLPEPGGGVTARLTGRNPSWEDEDRLRILAGADIGYTDRILTINPFGAYSVEKAVPVSYRNDAAAGRESSDAATVWKHGAADRRAALADRIGRGGGPRPKEGGDGEVY